jgi:hypothetical protein
MIALAPKMYTCFNGEVPASVRMKSVSRRLNHPVPNDYREILEKHSVKQGLNRNLYPHNNVMCKISVVKNMLTAAHTKMFVLLDFSSCGPLFIQVHNKLEYEEEPLRIS